MVLKRKIICFDIDNVICKTSKSNYKNSKPIPEAIKKINQLYSKKYNIILFTSRFMGRTKDNRFKAKKLGYKLTKKQLSIWGVKYNKLIMGKPSYDYFVDDKSFNNFRELMKKIK